MKIYTKTGDQGQTSLFSGGRVPKNHPRVQVYGTLDEANSALGLAVAHLKDPAVSPFKASMTRIQNELFNLGSELATPDPVRLKIPLVQNADIERLEHEIDSMETQLEPLKNFILPTGTPAAAATHLARTICRRAEREMLVLMEYAKEQGESIRPECIQYVNRLSDYLFVLSRAINKQEGGTETAWSK